MKINSLSVHWRDIRRFIYANAIAASYGLLA